MAACDPQTLATQASCINCNISPGMQIPVLIYLMCQIANGVPAAALAGNGSPVGVVNATAANQIYADTTGNHLWISTAAGTGSWHQLS